VLTGNADEDGSGNVSLGDTLTYTITATNNGTSTLNNVVVTDSLTGDTTTCVTLAPGATCVLTATYVVTAADVTAGQIVNTGTADSDETPPVNDPHTEVFVPAIDVSKTPPTQSVVSGGTASFTITVDNIGNANLSSVVVNDPLCTTLTGPTGDDGDSVLETTEIWTYICTVINVTASFTNTVTATGTPPTGPNVTDTATANVTVTTVVVPPVVPTNTPAPSTGGSLIVLFDPAMSKIGFLRPGELSLTGEQVEWFFTVTNIGTATGTNIVVSDTMRSELRIDSVNVSSPLSSTTSGQTVTVTIPSLAPGQTVNFSVVTTVISGGGQIDNTACLTASNYSGELCVTAPVITTQPQTGESPWWYSLLLGLAVVMGIAAISGSVWMFRRRHYA
jgi:uncharacterized repeat protein (TIGR01451 family)/LPXTG-motif cell wall-anchored protein